MSEICPCLLVLTSWLFHVAFLDKFAPWHWTVCQQSGHFIVRWVCRQCQNLGRSNGGDQRTTFSQIWYQISHQNSHILWWTQIHIGCDFTFQQVLLSSNLNWHNRYGITIWRPHILWKRLLDKKRPQLRPCWQIWEQPAGQQQQQPGMPGMFTSPLFVTSITPLLLPRSPPSKTLPKIWEGWMLEKLSVSRSDEGRCGANE